MHTKAASTPSNLDVFITYCQVLVSLQYPKNSMLKCNYEFKKGKYFFFTP